MPGSLRNTWINWLRKKPSPLLLYPIFAIIFGITFALDLLVIKSIEILTDNIKSPPPKNADDIHQYQFILNVSHLFHTISIVGLLFTGVLIFLFALAAHWKILKKQPTRCTLEELLKHSRKPLVGIIMINSSFAAPVWIIFLINLAITWPLLLLVIIIPILIFVYAVTVILLLVYAFLEILCIYTDVW